MSNNSNLRSSKYPINPIILNRTSKRAMSGETLSKEELMTLFEAARWAPSSNNNQLTRFVYASKDTEHWSTFLELLADGNKIWCKNASNLIIILSRKNSYYKSSDQRSHSFEAGSAFENMAIQGTSQNLVIHPMGGFDYAKARELLSLENIWDIECMVAVGKPGDVSSLPKELQDSDNQPSTRNPLDQIVFEGIFTEK